jgi:hypothetical protein
MNKFMLSSSDDHRPCLERSLVAVFQSLAIMESESDVAAGELEAKILEYGSLKFIFISVNSNTFGWSSLMSTAAISCTTVLKPRNRNVQSHTFLNLPITDELLGKRGGVRSVLIGSLLSVLRQRMLVESEVSDGLARILSGVESDRETVTVATTRVPIFGTDMQDPLNGYRPLARLTSINVQMEIPSHSAIQYDRELLAARFGDDSDSKTFQRTWGPYGVTVENHFIIIFIPLSHDDSAQVSSRNDIPSGSCYSYPVTSPLFTTPVSVAWLRGVANASDEIARTNSPASAMGFNHQQSLNDPGSGVTQFSEATSSQNAHDFLPGTSIETVCTHHGITNDIMHSAKFLTTEKSLVRMVRNYKWMLHILKCIGLQERNAAFAPLRTAAFAGGLILSAGEVVKHFGWAVDSFKHKNVWYGWAEEAVESREWAGTPPSKSHDSAAIYVYS